MARHAIVTGTSRGIGAAVARALLERGWRVTGVARGAAPAELVSERYEHARLDLADLDAVAAWFEGPWRARLAAASRVGRLGLVNNAGVLEPIGPVARLAAGAVARSLLVNVAAPLWLAGFAVRQAAGRPLRIVDVSSGAATSPYAGWGPYCAGKAALRMADQVLARELEDYPELAPGDVAVVTYAPHVVATRMQEEIRAADPSDFPSLPRFQSLHEGGHLVAPEGPAAEIADLLEADDLPGWSERRFEP